MNTYRVRAEFQVRGEEGNGRTFSFDTTVGADNPCAAGIAVGLSGAAMLADKMGRELMGNGGEANPAGPGARLSGATLLAFSELIMRGKARGVATEPSAEAAPPAAGNGSTKGGQTKARKGSGRKRAGNAKPRARFAKGPGGRA